MEQRAYKGFSIVTDPQRDPERGVWVPHYLLFQTTGTDIQVRELASDQEFDSPEEASEHCFGHARFLINASRELARYTAG